MMRTSMIFVATAIALAGCVKETAPDAHGNFEADELTVSAQTSGELRVFTASEGTRVERGAIVGVIDTMQIALELTQIAAQKRAVAARAAAADEQTSVLETQIAISRRAYERTVRLAAEQAATAQQVDQAERDHRTLAAQVDASRAQRASVLSESGVLDARAAQLRDRLTRSRIANPASGTVLTTMVNEGEVVQAGQPLYRLANLDTLTLRAFVAGPQLGSIRLGETVSVQVDQGDGSLRSVRGIITWVSSKAEFTPTPIQTRDERTDLVYAVKIRVPNADGSLKIGMPADLALRPLR